MGWLNVGSLVLGLIAWTLPIICLLQPAKQEYRKWAALSIFSLSACAISLCLQIFYMHHIVHIADWAALMDTMGAVSYAAVSFAYCHNPVKC